MALALAAALLWSSTATTPACSWDRPGLHPYTGDVVQAVDRYTDIPRDVRNTLKRRMASHQYDELVAIRRDSITGRQRYGADIRDMHFGAGSVCRNVSRAAWAPTLVERGLVYCEGEHCILVPLVCRNVSRIARLQPERSTGAGGVLPSLPGGIGSPVDAGSQPAGAGGNLQPSGPLTGVSLPGLATLALVPGDGGGDGGGTGIAYPLRGLDHFGGGGGIAFPSGSGGLGPIPVVPEPGTWALWTAGLTGLALLARRRSCSADRTPGQA